MKIDISVEQTEDIIEALLHPNQLHNLLLIQLLALKINEAENIERELNKYK